MEKRVIIAPQNTARMVWFREFIEEFQGEIQQVHFPAKSITMKNGDKYYFICVSQLPEWCCGREYTHWYSMDDYYVPEKFWDLLNSRIIGE